jgi:molecular chaperone HscB
MQADLNQNYFELFSLPLSFEVDSEILSLRYRDLQRAVHPDRFANASEQEQRLSVQQAAHINEAFQTLKKPMARARYLLELKNVVIDDTDTSMAPAFLIEQMELREQLGAVRQAADPFAALDKSRDNIESLERAMVDALRLDFAESTPDALEHARQTVRKMQFMHRLLEEAADLEEELVHES